eukprot:Partr_v1_DN27118_c0_g1_i1_m15718 putative PAK1 interacting protein 1
MKKEQPAFTVYLGTYERVLIGIDAFERDSSNLDLEMCIGYAAHTASIKALSAGGNQLATGSTDEVIKLYDIKKRKELGAMHAHTGTISCLQYYNSTHLLSAASDGTIQIYRTKDYTLLKTLKGHKAPVSSIAIHPTGKITLSLDRSSSLKMWDLSTGRCAYTTKLQPECSEVATKFLHGAADIPEFVKWNRGGSAYAVLYRYHIDIFSSAVSEHSESPNDESVKVIESDNIRVKLNCMAFMPGSDDTAVVVGCEDGSIRKYDLSALSKPCCTFIAHGARVRALEFALIGDLKLLVTASTNGEVKVWSYGDDMLMSAPKLMATHSCGMRINCLIVKQWVGDVESVMEALAEDGEIESMEEEEEIVQVKKKKKRVQ